MLSKSAFNALLKTLEEPPSHVKFILATTEPEKVLPTILSRCQRYDFRNISSKEIAAHLKGICKAEKIGAEEDALALVAKAGAGSMRDALSLLDRLLSHGEKKLSVKDVEEMLGLPKAQLVFELVESIGGGDVKQALERSGALIAAGLSPDGLIAALSDHLRSLLIVLTCGKESGLLDVPGLEETDLAGQAGKFDAATLAQDIAILEELRRNMRQNQTGRAMLDATLVRIALAEQFSSIGPMLGQGGAAAPPAEKKKPEPARIPQKVEAIEPPQPIADADSPNFWADFLKMLQGQAPAVAGVLGKGKLNGIEDGVATISIPRHSDSFVKQWSANGKREQIARALSEVLGRPTGVRFEIGDEPEAPGPKAPVAEADAGPIVEFVLKEFGGRLTRVE
jgi:DNA polymerase-3 subunit gamma/tau